MPSTRSFALWIGSFALVALPGLATVQTTGTGTELEFATRMAISFVVSLVVYLALGGGLVAFGPGYARETVAAIRTDPGGAFGWGVLAGVVVPIVLVLLAVTIVGLVVALPGFILLFFVGIVGNAVTVVWIGTLLGDERPDATAVGLGALALALVSAIPLLGGVLTTLIGFFGLGVVSRRLYESRRGEDPGRRDAPTTPTRRHEDL